MAGIRNYLAVGPKMGLRFTINRHNYHELNQTFDLIEEEHKRLGACTMAERGIKMQLSHIDRRLLNLIQAEFPVCSEPYRVFGETLGIGEYEVLKRLERLVQQGIIRRLGGVYDSHRIGYKGTLCGLRVPQNRVKEVADVINSYTGITHNYLRDHEYNMWFTILAQSKEKVEQILKEIEEKTGIQDIINLPSKRYFKVKVTFDVEKVAEKKVDEEKNECKRIG